MVAREKPATTDPFLKGIAERGTVSGRFSHITPNVSSEPKSAATRKDAFSTHTFKGELPGPFKINTRSKPTDFGEHRRYYVGQVQFVFIAHYEVTDVYVVHLTTQDDIPGGNQFHSEQAAEDFLYRQLTREFNE